MAGKTTVRNLRAREGAVAGDLPARRRRRCFPWDALRHLPDRRGCLFMDIILLLPPFILNLNLTNLTSKNLRKLKKWINRSSDGGSHLRHPGAVECGKSALISLFSSLISCFLLFKGDRFIPARSRMNLDRARCSLTMRFDDAAKSGLPEFSTSTKVSKFISITPWNFLFYETFFCRGNRKSTRES